MESKANEYQLRQGDKIYVFSTGIIENAVRMSCKNSAGKNFTRDFSVFDINSIDPIFSQVQNEQEAIQLIDKCLSVHKVGVSEDMGLIRIIFYVSGKGGIDHQFEIALEESSQDGLNNDNNLQTTTNAAYEGQSTETFPQTYDTANYANADINSYGQQSYLSPPNITPVYENAATDSNFNANDYLSQYQTSGVETYNQGGNFGTFLGQDNNQYLQSDFGTTGTTNFGGLNTYLPSNDYNFNSYEYTSNQYTTTTGNNDYSSGYDNNYQTTGTTFDINSLSNLNNLYSQPLESYSQQTYEKTNYSKNVNDVLPTITPADDLESPTQANTLINTVTEKKYSSQTSPMANQKLTQTTRQYQSVQKTINQTSIPKRESIQPLLNNNEIELHKLKMQLAETEALKNQLSELEPIKREIQQLEALKRQLSELNTLRAKVAQLNSVKSQIGELTSLRQQVSQMSILKKQLEELDDIRVKAEDTEELKKRILDLEKSKLEYEQEIRELRETQRLSTLAAAQKSTAAAEKRILERRAVETKVVENRAVESRKGLESRQITFEDTPEQICVKGDIIHDTKELEMIARKINKTNRKLSLNLLYKATADSDKAAAFHSKCDEARSSIVLIETDKGKRFGGFTTCSWRGDCIDKKDEDAFIFSLDKMKTYDNIPGEDAIGCYPKFGPIFLGCQIRIYDNAFTKPGTTYEKGLNFNTEEDYELTDGDRTFNVKEIEVYEVIPS